VERVSCNSVWPINYIEWWNVNGSQRAEGCDSQQTFLQQECFCGFQNVCQHIVANCSPSEAVEVVGLGAKELLPDPDCVAIRGQIRRVRAPWMKHAWFLDDAYYILPQVDCVVVGGTQQRGNSQEAVDLADTKRIWDTVTAHWPCLKTAEVLSDWVRTWLRCCWCSLENPIMCLSWLAPLCTFRASLLS
jgi:hypothetical protein